MLAKVLRWGHQLCVRVSSWAGWLIVYNAGGRSLSFAPSAVHTLAVDAQNVMYEAGNVVRLFVQRSLPPCLAAMGMLVSIN
jgi:hypothetical protein